MLGLISIKMKLVIQVIMAAEEHALGYALVDVLIQIKVLAEVDLVLLNLQDHQLMLVVLMKIIVMIVIFLANKVVDLVVLIDVLANLLLIPAEIIVQEDVDRVVKLFALLIVKIHALEIVMDAQDAVVDVVDVVDALVTAMEIVQEVVEMVVQQDA